MHENRTSQQQLLVVILQMIDEQNIPLSSIEQERLAQEVLDEVFGLGPLEPLLKEPNVYDILVNMYNSVYVERRGLLEKTNIVFSETEGLREFRSLATDKLPRALHHHLGRVDTIESESFTLSTLPLVVYVQRKWVGPLKMVPVGDMFADSNEKLPGAGPSLVYSPH